MVNPMILTAFNPFQVSCYTVTNLPSRAMPSVQAFDAVWQPTLHREHDEVSPSSVSQELRIHRFILFVTLSSAATTTCICPLFEYTVEPSRDVEKDPPQSFLSLSYLLTISEKSYTQNFPSLFVLNMTSSGLVSYFYKSWDALSRLVSIWALSAAPMTTEFLHMMFPLATNMAPFEKTRNILRDWGKRDQCTSYALRSSLLEAMEASWISSLSAKAWFGR